MKLRYKHIRATGLALIFLLVASLGIYGGYRALSESTSDLQPLTQEIQPRDFTLKIMANGELQSAESITIGVPSVPIQRLRIAWVIPDGTRVKKGDVLVEFDPTELDLKVMEHRNDLEIALQKLSKGEMASTSEKTDVMKEKKIAELELEKINEFLPRDEQIFARRQIIEGQLDRDYTEKKIVFADARLQLKGKVYSLEEAILMLERGQADTRINQAKSALAKLKLLSPGEGIVVYDPTFFFGGHTLMPGRVVYIGNPLCNLVNPDKMEARCFVLEKDAGELRPDQPVKITLDPFPGVEFTGKVKSIDKVARSLDRDSPVKYFQTIISMDQVDKELMKPGVKLKAEIIAGEMKDVIVVPRSAVVKKDSGFVAYVQRGPDRFEAVPVTLGQGDLVQVVVTGGLEAGWMLALNPPDVKQGFSQKKKSNGQGGSAESP